MITPIGTEPVTPRVYLDMDIADVGKPEDPAGMTGHPTLSAAYVGEATSGSLYRIEGPLPDLITWLQDEYTQDAEDILRYTKDAQLAK